jgi:hypothetical protein
MFLPFLIFAGAITSLVILLRRLPLQNIFALSVIVLVISSALEIASARTGIPFGKIFFHRDFGEKLFKVLPWPLPLLWLVVLLNGRAVAELILRRMREDKFYGYWLLGLSSVLAAFLFFNFAWHELYIRGDWTPQKIGSGMAGVFKRGSAMPLFFLVMTCWVIDKKSQKINLSFTPLIIWLLLNLYFIAAALLHHAFLMSAFIFSIAAFSSVLALQSKTSIRSEQSL